MQLFLRQSYSYRVSHQCWNFEILCYEKVVVWKIQGHIMKSNFEFCFWMHTSFFIKVKYLSKRIFFKISKVSLHLSSYKIRDWVLARFLENHLRIPNGGHFVWKYFSNLFLALFESDNIGKSMKFESSSEKFFWAETQMMGHKELGKFCHNDPTWNTSWENVFEIFFKSLFFEVPSLPQNFEKSLWTHKSVFWAEKVP